MFRVMDSIINISTPEKYQKYLRKIIISANMLQRKYFPGEVNETYNPIQVYDRISKKMGKLSLKIKDFENQRDTLKGQVIELEK